MDNNQTLRLLGRLSFPIFATIYGYHFHGKLNAKLLLYGLPLVILNYFLQNTIFFNILYCFFVGGLLLSIYNYLQKYRGILLLFLIIFNPFINIYFDYGLFAFFFMLASNQKQEKSRLIGFILVFSAYYIIQCLHFSFNTVNLILFAAMLAPEATLLYFYKNNTISSKNGAFQIYIKLLARYSLEIFVLQAIVFEIYYYLK